MRSRSGSTVAALLIFNSVCWGCLALAGAVSYAGRDSMSVTWARPGVFQVMAYFAWSLAGSAGLVLHGALSRSGGSPLLRAAIALQPLHLSLYLEPAFWPAWASSALIGALLAAALLTSASRS